MTQYPQLSDAAPAELLNQAQNQDLIKGADALWRATHGDLNATAKGVVNYKQPVLETATALRAVTAGTASVTAPLLAAALKQSGGSWSPVECDGAAATVFRSLPGMSVRRFFGDMGNLPSVPNDGILSSPDIYISGPEPLADPAKLLTDWNRDCGIRPAGNRANHAYVRGLNMYPGTQEGRVYMYVASGNIVNNPKQWTPLKARDGRDYAMIQAANTGNIWYSTVPFVWTPPANQHMCLITRIETAQYPNPLPPGGVDPSSWVSNNPAVAWRNYDSLAGLRGTRHDVLDFGNTGSETGDFVIAAVARNLPEGLTLRLQSKSGGIGFDTGPVAIRQQRQEIIAEVTLPPGFWGQLEMSIEHPSGAPLAADAFIDIRCYRKVAPHSSALALPARAHGLRQALGASNDSLHLVLLGSFAFGAG